MSIRFLKQFSLYIFLLCLFFGCSGNSGSALKSGKKTIPVNVSDIDLHSVKDFYSSIELIPLSVSDESVI